MQPIVIAILGFVGLLVVVAIVALVQRRLHPHGYKATAQEIRAELQAILDGRLYAIDDFTSIRLSEPQFEAMRQRILSLPEEFPPESTKQYCGPGAMEIIRGFVRKLEHEPT
jgi:hypothetical protein